MRGRRQPDGFLCYLVGWNDSLVIKAGSTMYRARWRSFVNRGATLYALHDSGRGHGVSSVDLECEVDAVLASRLPRAFHEKAEALTFLPGGCGYMECYRAADAAAYSDALAACSRIMLAHPVGHAVLAEMRPQMHGRTDARTYEDPHSPCATNPLLSDAHAHIREMDVDK